jgi:uncharacterized membrane protein
MALSHVRAGAHAFESHLVVDVGVLLAPVSPGILIYFFHQISSTIQVDNVVALIGQKLIDSIDNWIENHKHATRQGGRNDVPDREMMMDS